MQRNPAPTRRRVLKTLGAGVIGGTVLAGSAGAKGNDYGNGNAIGAFVNEEAMFKESPVWETGVADETGETEVDVLFGGLTDVTNPVTGDTFPGPWGLEPRVITVSRGTDVTWTWWDGKHAIDAHHLVSYFDPPYDEEFPNPLLGDDHHHPGGDEEFYEHEDLGDSFTYTFDEVGTYLYFCHPHGTPYSTYHPLLEQEVENLFGQRGAIRVVDD